MPMGPKDLVYTEEAVLLMDLVKTFAWKMLYEISADAVRNDGRGMVTIEDIQASLDAALAAVTAEAKRSAEALIVDRGV
jgi:hypothetical protein